MRVIHKYPLNLGSTKIMLPDGAVVLLVGEQNNDLFMWVMLDTEKAPTVQRHFKVFGTGKELPEIQEGTDPIAYIGTAFIGPFVWHIFELAP